MFKCLKYSLQGVRKFLVTLFSFYAEFSFKTKKKEQHTVFYRALTFLKIGVNEKWRILRKWKKNDLPKIGPIGGRRT